MGGKYELFEGKDGIYIVHTSSQHLAGSVSIRSQIPMTLSTWGNVESPWLATISAARSFSLEPGCPYPISLKTDNKLFVAISQLEGLLGEGPALLFVE